MSQAARQRRPRNERVAARIPTSVLLDVTQVLARAARPQARAGRVTTRELEVDQPRIARAIDEDVLLLVQIVVAHAALVQAQHESVEVIEEVLRQRFRSVKRLAIDPGAQEHVAGARQRTRRARRARERCIVDEFRNSRDGRERTQRAALAGHEQTRDDAAAQNASAARHATRARRASVDRDALHASERVFLQDQGRLPAVHARSIVAASSSRSTARVPTATETRHLAPATKVGDGRIVASGLSRRFGRKVALEPTDLDVGPGGITGLLGPNGSGKSTLLRCLLGIVRPDAGSASVDGVPLDRDGVRVRQRCAYSPGEIALYGELTGRAHLEWCLRGRGRAAEARALEIARELGLPLDRRVRAYSHGMKRQLLFAAALAPDVRVRILDEATEGLDPSKRGAVLELLKADAARGTTILLSSHHLGEVDRVCDRLIFLNEGRKLADETATSVGARAQRCVRFTFSQDADIGRIATELRGIDRVRLVVEGERIDVHLEQDDARPFIAAVCTSMTIPRPRSIEFGALSLAQMYRELYGVDGC